MDDGLQIFIYLISLAIWIFSAIQKNKKKSEKDKPIVYVPPPFEEEKTVEMVQETIENEKTIVSSDKSEGIYFKSYRDSIEYKEKKAARKSKALREERKEQEEFLKRTRNRIDWKQAIIHSEILRSRF